MQARAKYERITADGQRGSAGVLALALVTFLVAGAAQARWYKEAYVELGAKIYAEHCAACHGAKAEGAPQWFRRRADGSWPPPPLNGSAHAWHHPLKQLHGIIRDGGSDAMPAWRGVLGDGEILAAIAWFQSLWSDRIYEAWERVNKGGAGSSH